MSVALSYPFENELGGPSLGIRFQLRLSNSFANLKKIHFIGSLLDRQLEKQMAKFEPIQAKLDLLYDTLLEIDQQPVSEMKTRLIRDRKYLLRFSRRLFRDREKFEKKIHLGKAYLSQMENLIQRLDRVIYRLELFEYLDQSADFLLSLPDDVRYATMEFGMARVHKAMEADPVGKAEYEAEQEAWLNADFGPVVEYGD
jgi:hypothetical protein